MYRAVVKPGDDRTVSLPDEEIHHLIRVRRATAGEIFEALDGQGTVFRCRLERGPEGWYGVILEQHAGLHESPINIRLAQSLIKKDRFEWVLQKGTELGVLEFIPLITARTEVRLDEHRSSRKRERWEKILREATKQCGRAKIPELRDPVLLGEYLSEPTSAVQFYLEESGGQDPKSFLRRRPETQECTVLVGPEGGWDSADRRQLKTAEVEAVSLGPRILRTETAPIAILALLQYEWGDWGRN